MGKEGTIIYHPNHDEYAIVVPLKEVIDVVVSKSKNKEDLVLLNDKNLESLGKFYVGVLYANKIKEQFSKYPFQREPNVYGLIPRSMIDRWKADPEKLKKEIPKCKNRYKALEDWLKNKEVEDSYKQSNDSDFLEDKIKKASIAQ